MKKLEHYFNPLHVYCRLKDYHIPKARTLAEFYDHIYKKRKKYFTSKWTRRDYRNI